MTTWDPDGNGPQAPVVLIGGSFRSAGGIVADRIVEWDPATGQWSAMASSPGTNSYNVSALLVTTDGQLYAACNTLHRWNGTTWTSLGGPFSVRSITEMPNGDIVVGGDFAQIGSVPSLSVARLVHSTQQWEAVPGCGVSPGRAVAALPDGTFVVGGDAFNPGPGPFLQRWDGAAWSTVGGNTNAPVHALKTLANGDLLVGGGFTMAGGVSAGGIARWDGTQWSAFGTGTDNYVTALGVLPDGDIVATGMFLTAGGGIARRIARWDDPSATWSNFGEGLDDFASSLTVLPDGGVCVGGNFLSAGGTAASHFAAWDGADWRPLGPGFNGAIRTLAVDTAGRVFAGGDFSTVATLPASEVAIRTGGQWEPMGTGFPTASAPRASTALPNGDIVVVGTGFSSVTVPNVVRWDGTDWSAFAPAVNGNALCVLALQNGDLVVGGTFTQAGGLSANRIARWDGASWNAMASTGLGTVQAVAQLTDNTLVAACEPTTSGGPATIRSWNGSQWTTFGSAAGTSGVGGLVLSLAVLPGGDLVAGGRFHHLNTGPQSNCIARWNGSTWQPLGSGLTGDSASWTTAWVYALAINTQGDLIAAGQFRAAGGLPARNIARWDGAAWSALDLGVGATAADAIVYSLAILPDGTIAAGGTFQDAGGATSAHFATWGIPPGCTGLCDSIDFNTDTLFPDTQDIADFLTVFAGGVCGGQQPTDPPCNTDIDFNNDGLFPDTADIQSLLSVFGGGPCV